MSYEVMNECCCIQMCFVGVDQPPPPPFFFLRPPSFYKSKISPLFIDLLAKQKYWIILLTNLYIISTLKVLVKWKPDTMPLNSSWSIL